MKNYLLITNGRLLLFFLSFTFAINLNAQTYVIPHAELTYNTVTDHEGQYISYGPLENNREESYALGLTISHHLSRRFIFDLFFQTERLATTPVEGVGVTRTATGDIITYGHSLPIRRYAHYRYHYGLGGHFVISNKIQFFTSAMVVQTPKIILLSHKGRNTSFERSALPSKELEIAILVGLTYQLRNNFEISIFYRHGIWHNDEGVLGELDPVKSLGIRVGYRFKVLDKPTRKNKVACPKF